MVISNSRGHFGYPVLPYFFLFPFQPAEMSLEEIEGRLTSVLKSETISQLKSNVWKERLEGFHLYPYSCYLCNIY